jgi:hypothetical protein
MIVSPTKVGYRFTVKAEASGLVNRSMRVMFRRFAMVVGSFL